MAEIAFKLGCWGGIGNGRTYFQAGLLGRF
jgi:hypothetical protein